MSQAKQDAVNHPRHYTSHPAGIECIDVVEHMPFDVGNAVKYLWRAGLKGDAVEDLQKAVWYVNREIEKRTKPLNPAKFPNPPKSTKRRP